MGVWHTSAYATYIPVVLLVLRRLVSGGVGSSAEPLCGGLSSPRFCPSFFVSVLTKRSVRVLLRKLWAKMSEPDWRTVSKAVYLFHTILRDLPREHHDVLRIFLGKVLAFAQGPFQFFSFCFCLFYVWHEHGGGSYSTVYVCEYVCFWAHVVLEC